MALIFPVQFKSHQTKNMVESEMFLGWLKMFKNHKNAIYPCFLIQDTSFEMKTFAHIFELEEETEPIDFLYIQFLLQQIRTLNEKVRQEKAKNKALLSRYLQYIRGRTKNFSLSLNISNYILQNSNSQFRPF